MSPAPRCPDSIDRARAVGEPDAPSTAHALACSQCRTEIEGDRRLVALARSLPPPEVSAERVEAVRGAILASVCAPAAPRARWPRARWPRAAALACAAAAAAVLSIALWPRRSQPVVARAAPHAPMAVAVRAQSGARFVEVSGPPDQVVRLSEGTLSIDVPPLGRGERFRVSVGDDEVEVHGTAFDVTARADRLVRVNVARGSVAVRAGRRGQSLLRPGERWEAPAEPPASPSREAQPEPEPEPEPAKAVAPPRRAFVARAEPLRFPPLVPIAVGLEGRAMLSATSAAGEQAGPARGEGPGCPAGEVASSPSESARATPAEAAFEQGFAKLRSGRPAEAALLFDRAVKAAGGAPIGEDASFWRAVAFARVDRPAEAARAFRSFLDAFPDSNRSGEAAVMLGRLLLSQGDLAAARELFRSASKDPAPRVRQAAAVGLELTRDAPSDERAR